MIPLLRLLGVYGYIWQGLLSQTLSSNLLCSEEWPWTSDLLASVSQVLVRRGLALQSHPTYHMAFSKTKERKFCPCLTRSPHCPLTGTLSSSQSMYYLRQAYRLSKVKNQKTIRKKHTTKLPCNSDAQTLAAPKKKDEITREGGHLKDFFLWALFYY